MTDSFNKGPFLMLSTVLMLASITPRIVFSQIEWTEGRNISLGRIPARKDTLLIFPFHNGGSSPISIDNIRTLCGCTIPEWNPAPVFPGDSGEVRVIFRPDRKGHMRKSLKVWFHGMRKPETLIVQAESY